MFQIKSLSLLRIQIRLYLFTKRVYEKNSFWIQTLSKSSIERSFRNKGLRRSVLFHQIILLSFFSASKESERNSLEAGSALFLRDWCMTEVAWWSSLLQCCWCFASQNQVSRREGSCFTVEVLRKREGEWFQKGPFSEKHFALILVF